MTITWYGQSCFEIVVKNRENGETVIVTDPFSEEVGLKLPKLNADVLLITHQHPDHNNVKAVHPVKSREAGIPPSAELFDRVNGEHFLINSPGEYEIKDVFIQGIIASHDTQGGKERGDVIIYKIEGEDITLCHLADLGQKELTSEQLEQIGDVDILIIPVGGKVTIDAKEASEIISQIEPRVVIPMHYKIPNLKLKAELDGVDRFLKVMGEEGAVPEKKFKITAKNLPAEETKIVVLEP